MYILIKFPEEKSNNFIQFKARMREACDRENRDPTALRDVLRDVVWPEYRNAQTIRNRQAIKFDNCANFAVFIARGKKNNFVFSEFIVLKNISFIYFCLKVTMLTTAKSIIIDRQKT